MGWVEELKGKIVGIDTSPFIYYVERNPAYIENLRLFFQTVDRGEISIVTSIITLSETLVHPIRSGNIGLADKYKMLLFKSKNLLTIPVSEPIAEEAARLRAFHNLRTPDALQVATAINQGATAFLTNDIKLASLPGPKILILNELRSV